MKYFSMFSGIGGFEIGIQRAFDNTEITGLANVPQAEGVQDSTNDSGRHGRHIPTCIGYSEIDKYAIKVYERNFNGTTTTSSDWQQQADTESGFKNNGISHKSQQSDKPPKWGNNISNGEHINYGNATTINPADLPDFDLLVGGFPCQAFSIAGKRAGFDDTRGTLFFDVARILKHKRPRHLVLENVKGLLSHDGGKTFQTILGVLADLGYRVEWQVLNSKDFGVPQNRERIYIVGHLGRDCRRQVFPIRQDGREATKLQRHYSNTLTARYEAAQATGTYIANTISTGSTHTVGTYIGESKLNAQEIKQLNQPKHSNDRIYGTDGVSPTLNTMGGGLRQPFIAAQRGRENGQTLEPQLEDKTNSITSVAKDNYVVQPAQWQRTEKGKQARRESQRKGEDKTPFSDGHRELVPKESDVIGTITSQAIAKDSLLFENARIRRLTPVECMRLQGFPDDWCDYDSEGEKISDTQKYKMAGNAVTVNVVEAVIKSMIGCL